MIKVGYNMDIDELKTRYLAIFDLDGMRNSWMPFESIFGISIEDVLTLEFDRLVDLYYKYKSMMLSTEQITGLNALFDYEKYQPKLAWFFMNPENKFDLHTCHYCNMAYVNAYGLSDSYDDVLDFVNNATRAEWRYWFDERALPDDKLSCLLSRKYGTLEEFNSCKFLAKRIELYARMKLIPKGSHFDLDHVLPKSICPVVGLSLFNFVPSCQVCNEKLKKDVELASTKSGWLKLSPTFAGSSFDKDVAIKLYPAASCSTFFELKRNNENYHLDFETKGDEAYENYVTVFRLRDRYNYHKEAALRILDLKERYTEEKRKELSRILSARDKISARDKMKQELFSEAQIREDIFQEGFSKDRCFAKLRKDMMERN